MLFAHFNLIEREQVVFILLLIGCGHQRSSSLQRSQFFEVLYQDIVQDTAVFHLGRVDHLKISGYNPVKCVDQL